MIQAISYSFLFKFVLIYFVAHKFFQFVIYLFFGLKYQCFNPFTLSIHNVTYTPIGSKQVFISIKRIRIHFSIFTSQDSYFRTTISGIEINLHSIIDSINIREKSSIGNNNKSSDDTNVDSNPETTPYDPNSPVCIYPHDKKLKRFAKFLATSLPRLTFKIYNVCIHVNEKLLIKFDTIVGKTNISSSNIKTSFLKHTKNSDFNWDSSLQIINASLYKADTDEILTKFFNICQVSVTFQIDLKTGIIHSVDPKFSLSEIDISVLYFLKLIKSLYPSFHLKDNNSSNNNDNVNTSQIKKYKLKCYGFVYRVLKRAVVNIQSLKISEIPVSTNSNINHFLENQKDTVLSDVLFAAISIGSFSIDVGLVSPDQVGYSLKFVEGSFPLQWLITFGNIKASLDYSKISNYSGKMKNADVLFIPNLLLTMESTMMINLLRVVFNQFASDNFIRKQTLTTVQLTLTNPSFDMSAEQIGIFMKIFNEIKSEHLGSNVEIHKSTNLPDDTLYGKKLYKSIFLDTLPKFQFKILIEKPILIIKSENEIQEDKDLHLLVYEPLMIGFQCDAVTVGRNMDVFFRLDIPEFSFIYQRNNLNRSAASYASLKDLSLKTAFRIDGTDTLKISFSLGSVMFDLTNLEVLNGISIVFNTLKKYLIKYNPAKKGLIKKSQNPKEALGHLFRELPSFFSKISISIGSIKLKVGSKSIFMPVKDLVDETNNENIFTNGKIFVPSSSTYKIYKMDFLIKSKTYESDSEDSSSSTPSSTHRLPDDYYWFVSSKISDISLTTNMEQPTLNIKTNKRVLKIPDININLFCLKTNVFELTNIIDSVIISHDVASHFTIFSSFYLIKSVFDHHNIFFNNDPEQNLSSLDGNKDEKIGLDVNKTVETKKPGLDEDEQGVEQTEKSILDLINIKWFVKEVQFKMDTPGAFSLRIDLYDLKGYKVNRIINMEKKLIRLSVKRHLESQFYNKFFTIDNMKVVCQLPNKKHKLTRMVIYDNYIKISVPSNFVVHSLFDAIILTMKLTKKFIKTLKSGVTSGLDTASATGIVNLPKIKIKSNVFGLVLEDDPFEANLAMTFQLGLLEQRLRLQKEEQFQKFLDCLMVEAEAKLATEEMKKLYHYLESIQLGNKTNFDIKNPEVSTIIESISKNAHKLRFNISKSWIKLVDEYKLRKRKTLELNSHFLTGNLTPFINQTPSFNEKIVSFNEDPPLMELLFNDFVCKITQPKDDYNVHEFINRVGKGVPMDTNWDKIIPMHLDIKSSEVRIHLRDFPLPMVYIPNSKDGKIWSDSFRFIATFVFAEPMPVTKAEYWYYYIPMFKDMKEGGDSDLLYSWKAPKTITSVKSYYEIDCFINSDNSTMVTWSTAYQVVLRQLNIVFDTFSKITKDPSPKLGVWDKLRNIMHGYARFKWINPKSEVRINVLNSSDPYKIMTCNAGYSLAFKENIEWIANDPDRELERDYFIFRSNKILFGIPNFLSEPLPCWCSKYLVYMPASETNIIVNSLYGYYMNTDLYYDPNSDMKKLVDITSETKFKTYNICLDGDIELKLSMTFERKLPDGTKTSQFKSHFDNVLTNPIYVKGKDNFDSYEGFRSDYIHMAFNLKANDSIYNILRLAPRSVFLFMKWFKRFSNDVSLPIKNGPLWSSKNKSVKLGKHLMTFKFKFDVSPLYIYHGYRVDLTKFENKSCIGLKAKIGSFKCDLHERKENKVKHVEFFDRNYNIMKMSFYLGKIELNDIDLRIIGLNFENPKNPNHVKHNFQIFDNDSGWIDVNDFEEVDLPSLRKYDIEGQIFPLLHSSHFVYWMDKAVVENEFGCEKSHDCLIEESKFPNLKYNHVFDVEKLKFKWYCEVRNLLFEYITELEFRAAYVYSASYSARNAISKKLESLDKNSDTQKTNTNTYDTQNKFNINSPEEFENEMRKVQDYYRSVIAVDDMLVRLEDVQVQLMVDATSENLMLFRTQHNEIEIVALMDEDWFKYVQSATVAKRYGTIFENADLIILSKKEYESLDKNTNHYGSSGNWPVFLDGDEPEQLIKSKTLLSDVLIYFVMEKSSNSYASGRQRNKLYLNVPKFQTKIDSVSYLASFSLFSKLLMYVSPHKKHFAELTKSLTLTTEKHDKEIILKNLENTCNGIHELVNIHQSVTPMIYLSERERLLDTYFRNKMTKMFSNLVLMAKVLLLSYTPVNQENDDDCYLESMITIGAVNIELIKDNVPFLALSMNDALFSRFEMLDKSTFNEVKIKNIQILNNDYNILYPELLTVFTPGKLCCLKLPQRENMFDVTWELGQKVGGMHNIRKVRIDCFPMKICLEDKTGYKLMNFFFPNELKNKSQADDSDEDLDEYLNNVFDSDDDDDDENDESVDFSKDKKYIENSADSTTINTSTAKSNIASPGDSDSVKALDYISTSEDDESVNSFVQSLISNREYLSKYESHISSVSNTKTNVSSSYSRTLNKRIIQDSKFDTDSGFVDSVKAEASEKKLSALKAFDNKEFDVSQISERAKQYFAIGTFQFSDLVLNITLFGKGKLRLINVNDLTLVVPKFVVKKAIWTKVDMINAIKKHIIKTLLKQTGKLLKNKLFVFKRRKRINQKKSVKKREMIN